ncbi:DUF2855 family protein [Marinicauda algicola]|uniref:DUF2855 family protein n=1 Tax=Marinicauda algicola TaxID=2029849 RepID=A0A4S2H266_9PROT|nr:DUF2855 family protein [Marinicauda algicola]TGY89262.1 DUF2855 family protein [Marinicauda algicola]
MSWALAIEKTDISSAQIVEETARELAPGEARLAVKRFALTANNVTYAVFGEAMGYWSFFPGADGRGRLPVWGFAEVAESRSEGLEPGERIYGYFPAGSTLIVEPARVDAGQFLDASAHRAALPGAYNRYVRCTGDAGYRPALEAAQMVLQPLFVTAFLIDLHLRETGFSGARQVTLTSASSKTAIALAFALSRRPVPGVAVEALTSPGNAAFVNALGFYDVVTLYEDAGRMGPDPRRLIVDFAGDGALNRTIHTALGDALAGNIRVGGAHWERAAPPGAMPGPKPVFFFAPDHARNRISEWGAAEFARRYGEAWLAFAEAGPSLFEFEAKRGPQGTLEAYRALVANTVPARKALTVELA